MAIQIFIIIHKKHFKIPFKISTIFNRYYLNADIKVIYIMKDIYDNIKKYIFKTIDGYKISTVLINKQSINTLCISSQIGCLMGCDFCATSYMTFKRNLYVFEILNQIYNNYFDINNIKLLKKIYTILYMGMGEPLHNYKNVIKSVLILNNIIINNIVKYRIIISTVGYLKYIYKISILKGIKITISLNASTDIVRNKIMPINKKWNIESIINVYINYLNKNFNKITVAYILLKGLNDSNDSALELIKILNNNFIKNINLIPFNMHKFINYKKTSYNNIKIFQNILKFNGVNTFIRFSKGIKIQAACGTLNE